jgi:predicted dehydrogenase
MAERRLGIIMHGVTGRMGANQHLERSILALRAERGVVLGDGTRMLPDPVLVGRNADKLGALARAHDIVRWTTDLDQVLADAELPVFFDSATTPLRAGLLHKALDAGKHVYCEKPVAETVAEAVSVARHARQAGVKHGVVQDKLWLPGIRKLRLLIDSGFFGRVLSVRGEFGYWVFEGDLQPAQRPSWNYRKDDGGGLILDMLPHWHYLLDTLFGRVEAVSCRGATHIPERWDEDGQRYEATAEDAAYATFEIEGGVIAHFNSSWAVRVRRDDLLTIQVDGTHGSAVAGLRRCWTQARVNTPKPVWNPDVTASIDYRDGWHEVPDTLDYDNAFKQQWELFIRHVCEDAPFPWDLRAGARGVQLAELATTSWRERRWIDIPELEE